MDMANKAICYAHRNPPPGCKKTKLEDIQKIVCNTAGGEVTLQAISLAAKTFHEEKEQRGRKKGWRKTTKAEDKVLLTTFHKLRPPGCGVDSGEIHRTLPKKLKNKTVFHTRIKNSKTHISYNLMNQPLQEPTIQFSLRPKPELRRERTNSEKDVVWVKKCTPELD